MIWIFLYLLFAVCSAYVSFRIAKNDAEVVSYSGKPTYYKVTINHLLLVFFATIFSLLGLILCLVYNDNDVDFTLFRIEKKEKK
jgi:ABC-type Fe3+ transport system permease subunit